MQLKIITQSKGVEINKEVALVEAEGVNGSFGILDNHLPFITILKDKSELKYKSKASSPFHTFQLEDSLLEVADTDKGTEIRVIASSILQLD